MQWHKFHFGILSQIVSVHFSCGGCDSTWNGQGSAVWEKTQLQQHMGNTLSKQCYFIKLHQPCLIQIPCNSNHLLPGPSIQSWEDWCPWKIIVFQTIHAHLVWRSHSGLGALGEEVVWREASPGRVRKCFSGLGTAVSMCWDSRVIPEESHWSIQRFGAQRITSYLYDFLFHVGRSRA